MSNPWLEISEVDYVGHMSSPAVNQRPVLSRLLGEVLDSTRPRTVLVLGCSTGNGLEHVNSAVTSRVAVLDVNPRYLQKLGEAFPDPGFQLDIRCADLAEAVFEPGAFDLVHAGLVLEYVDWSLVLPRLAATLSPGGILSVVLQLPSLTGPAVTRTEFTTLQLLESLFHFVEPDALVAAARGVGLTVDSRRTEPLKGGKAFEVLRFVKTPSGVSR